jgi:UDP-4-amino-4,6-dideoxy-N-acetyl-beta-L-altrosamine transaminase
MIPYGCQDITQEDIDQVLTVLNSDFITQGPYVDRFEESVRNYVNSQFAVSVNSATSALHIACLALGIGKGDLVWTSANTFVASSNCALYCGASVDFIDIDPITFNMCVESLEQKLYEAKLKNALPKLLIPVHFAGHPCDMEKIHDLSKRYGFYIIEDASHAIGAAYKLQNSLNDEWCKVGSCKHSDITIFSFHPVKIITTAEGGIALTNNKDWADRMQKYRSHGITKNNSDFYQSNDSKWFYEQHLLGYNYRLTDIQAALGLSQMNRLDQYIKARNQIANYYDNSLKGLPIRTPIVKAGFLSSFHLYCILLDDHAKREGVFNHLRDKNIGVNVHYIPVHTQPFYKELGFQNKSLPICEDYYSRTLSLPMFPKLSKEN